MKQSINDESDIRSLINKMQVQLFAIDHKLNVLMNRSMPETKLPEKPVDHHKERMMYSAICADCKKECSIPFKPSGERPVYCKECFSRRKSGNTPKTVIENKPQQAVLVPEVSPIALKKKKKTVLVKKAAKKKVVPKKK